MLTRTKDSKALAAFAIAALLFAIAAFWPRPAHAATFAVTNTADSGPGSLRQAITDANNTAGDDTISIGATGTINLQSELPSLFTNVQIQGPGADELTVRRDTGGDYPILRVFDCNVVVGGLTMTNGSDPFGAGGMVIVDNGGTHSVTLRDVAIVGNTSGAFGGGIDNSADTLTLIDSTVSGNAAGYSGGGILNRSGSTLELTSSKVSGNSSANGTGGGISNSGDLTLTDSALDGNTALSGSGISNSGTAQITRSAISGNSAGGGIGGGVANGSGGTLALTNSTVSGNTAASDGGGISNSGNLALASVTLSDNAAPSGANLRSFAPATVKNTILANPQSGASCDASDASNITSQGHNLDEDGSCVEPATGDITGVDPKLGPLQDNGGPTPTHGLLGGSPAVDAAAACPSTDQRGSFRDDGDANGPRACDIGAFERQVAPRVIRVAPADGAMGVSPRANVIAVFSEAMNANSLRNPTTLRSKTFTLRKAGTTTRLNAGVTYDPATRRAVLNPKADLTRGATYIAAVTTGARDLAGNALDQTPSVSGNQPKTWKFTVQ